MGRNLSNISNIRFKTPVDSLIQNKSDIADHISPINSRCDLDLLQYIQIQMGIVQKELLDDQVTWS